MRWMMGCNLNLWSSFVLSGWLEKMTRNNWMRPRRKWFDVEPDSRCFKARLTMFRLGSGSATKAQLMAVISASD